MVLLEGEQVMGIVWCCAYDNTQQQPKKVMCQMEAMRLWHVHHVQFFASGTIE
jgi:hypothetical protein